MNPELTGRPSPTFGQIVERVEDRCVNCKDRFQRPLLDLRWQVGTTILGGEISTKICPKCQAIQERGQGLQAPRETRKPWHVVCPPKYANIEPQRLPEAAKRHAEAVFDWNWRGGRGLGLIGPSDHGKSMLLHAVAKGIYLAGIDLHLTYATQFAVDMANTRVRFEELDRCCTAPWLLMDDVGKEKMTARVESDFYHVLETRERYNRPMLVTVNSTREELAAEMSADRGMPIVNRLAHLCDFITIE